MLSLAIDNTNTPNRAYEFQAKASEDNGATGEATMRPADSMTGEVSRVDAGRTASATSERMGVTAGETATHSNSRVSSRADMAGEAYPSQTRTSPATPFNSTGATVEAETITSQAVSATYSTWSPWSVCKGSI